MQRVRVDVTWNKKNNNVKYNIFISVCFYMDFFIFYIVLLVNIELIRTIIIIINAKRFERTWTVMIYNFVGTRVYVQRISIKFSNVTF